MLNNQILAICMLLIVMALNTVKTESPAELLPHNQPVLQGNNANPKLTRAKRMYALCPPEFLKIGNECYFISKKKESWLDAHFDCKDRNSKLAEPLKFADRRLKKYLQNRDEVTGEKSLWIGGMFNWQTNNWQYGYNGGAMKYQGFDDNFQRDNMQYHCTAMDSSVEFRWTAKQCTERHFFICQHRMSFVNEKNRHKVYTKWNETYPNQMANEVEVYVSTNGNGNRSNMYRKRSRVNRINQANNRELQQQKKKIDMTTTTTAPDYLPFNVYKNLETMDQQKPQQEDVPSQITALQSDQQQPSLKQRKRHSKPIKISGDVDLGMNFNQKNIQRRRQKNRKTTTENPQHESHHHNHHHHPNNALPEPENEKIEEETTAAAAAVVPSFIVDETTTTTTTTTTTSSTDGPIEKSELKKKLEEKALRRERLKAKLAQLTPEERQAFLLMKQQRADARKKGLSYAKSI